MNMHINRNRNIDTNMAIVICGDTRSVIKYVPIVLTHLWSSPLHTTAMTEF